MAVDFDITGGTITLTSGLTAFTTNDVNMVTRKVLPGDQIYIPETGGWLVINTVTDENSGTLTDPCPAAAAGVDKPVRIRYQPDNSRISAQTRNLIDLLSGKAFFQFDASGTLVERAAYDEARAGFTFVDITTNPMGLYIKASDATGDWAGPSAYLQGEQGIQGEKGDKGDKGDTGDTGPANTLTVGTVTSVTTAPDVTITGTSPNQVINFWLQKGDKGDGFSINAQGPTADRALYDDEPKDFTFLDLDTSLLYFKNSNASGDWSDGIEFGKGDPGDSGALITTSPITGDGTAGPYALVAGPTGLNSILMVSVSGVEQYDYTIAGTGPYTITFAQPIPIGVQGLVKMSGPLPVGTAQAVDPGIIDAPAITDDPVKQDQIRAKIGAVAGPASSVDGRVAAFDGATGELLKDGGKLVSDLVVGPATSTAKRLAVFADLTGELLAESSGLTLAEQGRALADLGAGVLDGFRNKIINGDFAIAQRGASWGPTGGARYAVDRWQMRPPTGGAWTVNRLIANPFADFPFPATSYLGINQSVVGTQGAYLMQPIENVLTLNGKRATFTFYVLSDQDISITIRAFQYFGTGGSPSPNVAIPITTAQSGVGVLKKITAAFDVPSVIGKSVGTNGDDCLQIYIDFPINSTWNCRIAHVSLVEGDATLEDDPFEPRHIQQELALCQRYYEKSYNLGTNPGTASTAIGAIVIPRSTTTAQNFTAVRFKVEKRIIPTMTAYSTITGASGVVRSTSGAVDLTATFYDAGTSGCYVGATFPVVDHAGAFQFTADAEF